MKEFENPNYDKELAELISMEVDQILQEIKAEEASAEAVAEAQPDAVAEAPVEEISADAEAVETLPDDQLQPEGELPLEESAQEAAVEEEAPSEPELTDAELEAAKQQVLQELYPEEAALEEEAPPRKVSVKAIVLGVVAALILMLGALAAGVGMYVRDIDTIYPQISVMDVDIGGMTVEEAEAALTDANVGNMADVAITLEMPGGKLELTYADVGFMHPAGEIAQMAYDYGRDGGTVSDTIRFLGCMLFETDFTELVLDLPSKGYIEALLENAVIQAELALNAEVVLDTEAQTLTVIKGAQHIQLDRSKMLDLLMKAIKTRNYGTLTYEPASTDNGKDELELLKEQFTAEAADAYYDQESGTIVPEIVGVAFDDGVVAEQWNAAQAGDTVVLSVLITMPAETEAHLNEVLFSKTLAESVTSLRNSSKNRNNNVGKAVEKLNGLVMMPGEQLSYNNLLGKRTKENGYLEADAYLGGQVVKEYGGGICQVSSALYYCALLSELQIDERTNHTFRVNYLPLSYDATVSWGGPDFKFTNDRAYPIRIDASMTDKELKVSIVGTDNGKYVKLTNSSSYGYTNPEYPDVATGIVSEATRWVYDSTTDALLKKERLGTDFYHYHEEEIKYPSPTPESTPEPTPVVTPEPTPVPTPEPTPQPEQTEQSGETPSAE